MKEFTERLKDLRLEKNLSVKSLAKILQVSHTTISRWENGVIVPSIDHLYNICEYFGVSADFMIGREE